MLKKIKTMLSLLLVAMMVIGVVPMSAFAEENVQDVSIGIEENEGVIIEELDMSNFTIVVLDKDGNVKPMIMPMSTTTAQTWPDMTLGAGETFILYNNKNDGYISIPSGSRCEMRGKTNKNFTYKVGFKSKSDSSFSYSGSLSFTTGSTTFGVAYTSSICFSIKNVSTYSVKLSGLKAVLIN